MMSSSLHVPICVAADAWELNRNGGKSLRRENVEDRSISHRIFLELFNARMLGSRQTSWDDLQALYKQHSILEGDDNIIVHVQESPLL
jgi:hypothetical protein